MSVTAPNEGAEVVCALIGMDTDVEAMVAHVDGVVRIEYSRPSASQRRSTYLIEQYPAGDPALVLVLSRLRLRNAE